MNKQLIFLLLAAFFLAYCSSEPANQSVATAASSTPKNPETVTLTNSITAEEKADGWVQLFDGRSFDNWRGYNQDGVPEKGWTIENGALVCNGGGDLITEKQYEDFDLKLEFNLSEAANSGIFYFVQEIDGQPIYYSAPEFQLVDNRTYIDNQGMDIMDKHLTGDNYDLHDGIANPGITHGQWYDARIVVKDHHVEHWVNGKKHVEYDWNSPEWQKLVNASKFKDWAYGKKGTGHIGLQDHGNVARFRNIKIREL